MDQDLYYKLKYLKNDYSNTYAELNKLRLTADFKDYSLAPEIPNKEKTEHYLQEAEKLFDETSKFIKKAD